MSSKGMTSPSPGEKKTITTKKALYSVREIDDPSCLPEELLKSSRRCCLCDHDDGSDSVVSVVYVIRGIGKQLDLIKELLAHNEETDADQEGGIRWLANQTGMIQFRVFVSGQEETKKDDNNKDAETSNDREEDCDCNNVGEGSSISLLPETFTLDGTDHPDSILPTSMSRFMTLDEMIKCNEWKCRYMVEDDLCGSIMDQLVPSQPPKGISSVFATLDNSNNNVQSSSSSSLVLRQRQLFVSIGPCQTQVHRDCYDNIYICALGERHWTVAPPNDEWEREEGSVSASVQPPPPPSSPLANNEKDEPNSGDELADTNSTGFYNNVTLYAGDGIFVPAYWWHSVCSGSKASVAINWYFDPSPRPCTKSNNTGSVSAEESSNSNSNNKRRKV